MSNARVSVVVPAYNVESFISRCIRSLLDQSLESIEIVVVDDGSTDNTSTVVEDLSKGDCRVTLLRQRNGGLSAARNTGIRRARGEYVAFLDADDWAESAWLETIYRDAIQTKADVVVCGYIADYEGAGDTVAWSSVVCPRTFTVGKPGSVGPNLINSEFVNLLGYAWNKLYRREFLERHILRFTEGLSLVEDIEFNGRVLTKAKCVHFSDATLIHYVQRPRVSLGNMYYADLLTLRLISISSVGAILESWAVQPANLSKITRRAATNAVNEAVRSATAGCRMSGRAAAGRLRALLSVEASATILEMARPGLESGVHNFMLLRLVQLRWLGLACTAYCFARRAVRLWGTVVLKTSVTRRYRVNSSVP